MQIEQALYGECRGGHSLLASSGDAAVAEEIVQRLDLPDTAPPGVEWSPFLRGFPYKNQYVLSRTFRDAAASRGGMVYSHALLAPLDDIGETSDLRPLLNLLATSDRQRPDAVTVQVVITENGFPHADDLVGAAEALGTNGKLPVVRLDHVGFDGLVVALWANLSPEIRQGFAFRLSFDPRDLVETPRPTLVCTPRGMGSRWSGYPVISAVRSCEPTSLVAGKLSGHGKGAPLTGFMQEMALKPTTITELCLIEQAYCLEVDDPTFERRVGAVRLIGRLSPDADAGKEGKIALVRRLCEQLSKASAEEVLYVRNLELSAFPDPNRVWKALERWVARNSFHLEQDVEMLSVLEDATTGTNAVGGWRRAVLKGLAVATGSPRSSFPKAFWRWFQARPDIAVVVFRHVASEAAVEERLARATPRSLDKAASETLAADVLARGWLCLHGAVMSAICPTSEAVQRQVAVDSDIEFVDGLRWTLRHARGAKCVECALEIEDPRMARLAGEAVAKNPRLLAKVDLTPIRAQAIWREALIVEPEMWRAPADPVGAFRSILDHLLSGGETDTSLIERLSSSPVADLGTYPRRPEIWSRIGGAAVKKLLATTARGWLREAASGAVPFVPERDLQVAVLEDEQLNRTLDTLIPNSVGSAFRIVAALSRYDEQRFLRLLGDTTSRAASVSSPVAESIGRLVLERRWTDVATELIGQYRSGRRDLKPALRACCGMLGFWDRIYLGVAPISEWEKWEGMLELGAELYPGGPDDRGLWERAGGDDADLSTRGDGRSRWRRAVRDIRNGRGPSASTLLGAMMEDFPKNERIPHLAEDRVFGGGVRDGFQDD